MRGRLPGIGVRVAGSSGLESFDHLRELLTRGWTNTAYRPDGASLNRTGLAHLFLGQQRAQDRQKHRPQLGADSENLTHRFRHTVRDASRFIVQRPDEPSHQVSRTVRIEDRPVGGERAEAPDGSPFLRIVAAIEPAHEKAHNPWEPALRQVPQGVPILPAHRRFDFLFPIGTHNSLTPDQIAGTAPNLRRRPSGPRRSGGVVISIIPCVDSKNAGRPRRRQDGHPGSGRSAAAGAGASESSSRPVERFGQRTHWRELI